MSSKISMQVWQGESATDDTGGVPDMVSVLTTTRAVLICDDCGPIWWQHVATADEIPGVAEEHAQDHRENRA